MLLPRIPILGIGFYKVLYCTKNEDKINCPDGALKIWAVETYNLHTL